MFLSFCMTGLLFMISASLSVLILPTGISMPVHGWIFPWEFTRHEYRCLLHVNEAMVGCGLHLWPNLVSSIFSSLSNTSLISLTETWSSRCSFALPCVVIISK